MADIKKQSLIYHDVKAQIERTARESGVRIDITVNPNMFLQARH